MIQDLKLDSQRWQQEQQGRQDAGRGGSPYLRDSKVSRQPNSSLVAYQDSRTHAARQHWGPSESFSQTTSQNQSRDPEPRRSGHAGSQYASSEHYTTTPSVAAPYGSHTTAYQQSSYSTPSTSTYNTAPRTDPYATYGAPQRVESAGYAGTTTTYAGYGAPTQDYNRPAPPTHTYQSPRYFGYFDDQYLVYR
jgi:hypothetical protein